MNGIEFLIKQKGISKATCYTDNGTLYISDLAVILEEYHTHKQAGINLPVMQAEVSDGVSGAAVASEGQGEANTCADCGRTKDEDGTCYSCEYGAMFGH